MRPVVVRLAAAATVVVALAVLAGGCAAPEAAPDQDPSSADVGLTADQAQPPATTGTPKPKAKLSKVARVIDGDTIELDSGDRVRLVQIDSPEVGENECFADEATQMLSTILPLGTKIKLVADPKLDAVDRYDRLLRYVFKGKKNINLSLVQHGAASVWFYDGDKGRFANRLLRAAKRAKSKGRGLWGACPGTQLDPGRAVETTSVEAAPEPALPPEPTPAAGPTPEPAANCHPSYQGACLDPGLSDYDCQGGEGNGPGYTGTVTIVGPDEYGLDGDDDGVGCECESRRCSERELEPLGTIFVVLRCPLDWQEPALAPLHPDLGLRLQLEGRLVQTAEPNLDERLPGTDWLEQSRTTERAEATSTVA
jgi:endonuclease YncB( thermonuclease family)